MTGQPAVNVGDYVVARHKATTGHEVCGEVKAVRATPQIETDDGTRLWFDPDDWSFELAERPQPPLADGIYQKPNGPLRIRRDGRWSTTVGCLPLHKDDAYHRNNGWVYVGPEVSR